MGMLKILIAAAIIMAGTAAHGQATSPSNHLEGIDWENPVYATEFDSSNTLQDWSLEGGQSMLIEEGKLVLKSVGKNTKPAKGNHLVAWLKKPIPEDFYLEFDFKPKNKQQGLAIVFFSTRGIHGEAIDDPQLATRDGTFKQYHSGDLNGYHLSYWSGDRHASNLRKNKGFALLGSGSDPISNDQTDNFHRVGIYKKSGIIRYYVDGQPALEHIDDGTSNGPIWNHEGWIGLRQMDHTHWAQYERLSVYPLNESAPE